MQSVAKEMLDNLESKEREDKSCFWSMKEIINWQSDIYHKAHDGSLPNDFTYDVIAEVLEIIADCKNEEEAQDRIYEIEADVYTSDLTKWLGSDNNNIYYLTEAIENGVTDGFEALMTAQATAKQEIANSVLNSIIELV